MSGRRTASDWFALPKEFSMHWNRWIRQGHRWLSIIFTATVIANFVALGIGRPAEWLYVLPLPPLALLLFTGLYMFALPYVSGWRGGATDRSKP
jgi:hypothetical protein